MDIPADSATAAVRIRELTVDFPISDEQFDALRGLGRDRNELRSRVHFIRAVLGLTTLYQKFSADPSLKKLFNCYFSEILHNYERADVLFCVEHLSRLPKLEYDAGLSEHSHGSDPELPARLQLLQFCQAEAQRIGDLADRLFGCTLIATDENFDEQAYLLANPDIVSEMQAGRLDSVQYHFVNWGKNEGRRIKFLGEWPHDKLSAA
ncbi:hypothetical protein [Rhodoblastus sp.]|uniref:hypothetical protein n=1 Tax=Rhodoblastus sp. TaxID=1962975 RepID=UPI003F98A51A